MHANKLSNVTTRMFCIFASELASLIGLTPKWKTYKQAQADIWKRWNPQHFHSLAPKQPNTAENLIQLAAERKMTVEEVQTITNDQTVVQAVQYAQKAAQERPTAHQVLQEVQHHEEPVQKAIISAVNCAIGQACEKEGLDKHEITTNTQVTQRNNKGYRLKLDDDILLFGRVDGVDEQNKLIVEHKQRRNGLFRKVRDYERVQIQAYMALTGSTAATLIETFEDKQITHTVTFDAELWDKHVHQAIMRIRELSQIINSEDEEEHRRFFEAIQ